MATQRFVDRLLGGQVGACSSTFPGPRARQRLPDQQGASPKAQSASTALHLESVLKCKNRRNHEPFRTSTINDRNARGVDPLAVNPLAVNPLTVNPLTVAPLTADLRTD
jgi:hypothetical protein